MSYKNNILETLKWRGMLHDFTPNLEKVFKTKRVRGYIGFDPTASSLHIGNLATVMLLKHLQLAGHIPIVLIGGATGMVGDPSGKKTERQLLDEETLRFNEAQMKIQLAQFLDFETKINPAKMVNNYDWFKSYNYLDFLRDVGKHISVGYMLTKDSVKNRLETGLSFTEFSYQLLQGYDFYYLYKHEGVDLQMGGSDQWGNITTGIELIRKMSDKEERGAHALTCPLITKADGQKFGKSEGGNIWLDPKLTSAYKFYQFWLNTSDEDAPKLLKVFTLFNQEDIKNLEHEHDSAPHNRILQKRLSQEVTTMVHGKLACQKAIESSTILFSKSVDDPLQNIDEQTLLEVFEGVPTIHISFATWDNTESMSSLLSLETQNLIFKSKGEASRMIKGGGVRINQKKIVLNTPLSGFRLLQNKYLLVQKGKKNYFLISVNKD